MLTKIYIEALLVGEELADQVWETLDVGEIDGQFAWLAWLVVCFSMHAKSDVANW